MKPQDIFDRNDEWALLDTHARNGQARLGIVTGRRRVGKTFLLRRLADRHAGLFISCFVEEREPSLKRFADSLGRHHGIRLGMPPDWVAAFEQACFGPLAVPLLVVDEFPYLVEHSPEIESVLQHVVDRSRDQSETGGGTRIVIAGSSLAVMDDLLGGKKPLRGRADLQMNLQPFDFRTAAEFWNVEQPSVAFRCHAVLGGSPGYRRLAPDLPKTVSGFGGWVTQAILNPAAALYREDTYLLGEDRRLADRSVYSSILRAIAEGDHRPSRIAGKVGRAQTSLTHPFGVLSTAGFISNNEGLLSGRDPLYQTKDEILTFLYACVEPWRSLIDDGRSVDAWEIAQDTWNAQVLGPHLEVLGREWSARFASPKTLDGKPGIVGRGELSDAKDRVMKEVDVLILRPGQKPGRSAAVQCIGEAKLTADVDALFHLDRCADLLEQRGNTRPAKLLIFFETATKALRAESAKRGNVELIDLDRLYNGA
jgi:uncharacterized protein